jgi:formylglycine-generating enzyme required for sulfatase activity
VVRGGSWYYLPRFLRAASRDGVVVENYLIGFRLARTLGP